MNGKLKIGALIITAAFFAFKPIKKITTIYLIGDSTVANYQLEPDYMEKRHPLFGWGQAFQPFFNQNSIKELKNLVKTDSVLVDDRAKGGRSTRTFFQEGRWREVYTKLKKGDIVMMQFGHNDAAVDKTERYVNIEGYKEFLRLYVNQTREKGATPILLTPVNRNYPWKEGKLSNVHGEYPNAVKEIAKELNVKLIDLTQLSIDAFTAKGQEYVTSNYFMNFDKGLYKAYPEGQKDNTHFQKAGAEAVAQLVFDAMKKL
ncbi:Rhamnogalacturonan acetylesterase RhgT [compost metagenome]